MPNYLNRIPRGTGFTVPPDPTVYEALPWQHPTRRSGGLQLWLRTLDNAADANVFDRVTKSNFVLEGGNTTAPLSTAGPVGRAFALGGVVDRIATNAAIRALFGAGKDWSVAIWVRGPLQGANNTYFLSTKHIAGNVNAWGMRFDNAGNRLVVAASSSSASVTWLINGEGDNTWRQYILTKGGTTFKLYRNGVDTANTGGVATDASYVESFEGDNNPYVGNQPGRAYFTGEVGSVRVYDFALSGVEAPALYDYERAHEDLELWLELHDKAANTTVADSSHNTNDQALSGGDNTEDITVRGVTDASDGALEFDGSTDYVNLGADLDALIGAGTDFYVAFLAKNEAGQAGTRYLVSNDDLVSGSNALSWYSSGGDITCLFNCATRSFSHTWVGGDDGEWHDYAISRIGNVVNIWRDGSLDKTDNNVLNTGTLASTGFTIGGYNGNPSANVAVQDFRAGDTGVTQTDVDALYAEFNERLSGEGLLAQVGNWQGRPLYQDPVTEMYLHNDEWAMAGTQQWVVAPVRGDPYTDPWWKSISESRDNTPDVGEYELSPTSNPPDDVSLFIQEEP